MTREELMAELKAAHDPNSPHSFDEEVVEALLEYINDSEVTETYYALRAH